MKLKYLLLVPFVLTFSSVRLRAEHNGIELSEECKIAANYSDQNLNNSRIDSLKGGLCIGLVRGVMESMMIWEASDSKHTNQKLHGCIPEEVTPLEAVKVVTKYIDDNPAKMHERDVILIFYALTDAYPCKS